ncbi:MAG: carbohydrate ABC transporter permease [Chloroflexi bacterium]|nr:carbohydrate ABC transporter permease [Chloroflexota bacterium]
MKKKHLLIFVWAGLALAILGVYVFPYIYMVLTSFKTPNGVLSVPPTFFPEQFTLENYLQIQEYSYIPNTFLNSLIIAVLSSALTLVLAIPAAYAITRYNTRYGRAFLITTLIARMVPYISVAVPLFFVFRSIKLVGTYPAVIVGHMTISLPFAIWLLSSFFEGIPVELEEAARIDGCSRIQALLLVIIPITLGGIAVAAIFSFLASWNDFLFSLLLTSTSTKTAPLAIAEFNSQYGTMWGIMTSLATLFSLPVILVSLFLQKKVVAGATMGAVKG